MQFPFAEFTFSYKEYINEINLINNIALRGRSQEIQGYE
tara:strand:- start:796 stop:912 length:117 start_codon:yes stop_codon:yes gene_type:complete